MKNQSSITLLIVITLAVSAAVWYWALAPRSQMAAASAYPGGWIWEGDSQTLDRVPPIFLLRPSTLPANSISFDIMGKDRYLARGKTVKEFITMVWSQKNSLLKIRFETDLPDEKYDFIVADQPQWWNTLQSEINQRFHLIGRVETGESGDDEVVVRDSDTR